MGSIKATLEIIIYDVQSSRRVWEGKEYSVFKAATNLGLVDMEEAAYNAYLEGLVDCFRVNYNPNNAKIKIIKI